MTNSGHAGGRSVGPHLSPGSGRGSPPPARTPRAPSLARRRAIMEVSKAHYIDGRSKVEIARELGLSRFQAARMLNRAREVGIVSITLNSGAPMPERGKTVRDDLQLRNAQVAEAYGDQHNMRAAVGRETGTYLAGQLTEDDVLGLGWGGPLNAMLDGITYLPPAEVVQLSGWFGGGFRDGTAELARRAIALTGGLPKRFPRRSSPSTRAPWPFCAAVPTWRRWWMPSTGSPPPWSRSAPWARGPSPSPTPMCRSGSTSR